MSDLAAVLSAFRGATLCEAAVWTQAPDGKIVLEAATSGADVRGAIAPGATSVDSLETDGGRMLVAPVTGPRRAWLGLGPCLGPCLGLELCLWFGPGLGLRLDLGFA